MFELSLDGYLWVKAWHLIAAFAWMAGLFYLPRLFVYHAQVRQEASDEDEPIATFRVMERRLLRAIMIPAMVATVALGVWMLAANPALLFEPWFHLKLTAALALIAVHGLLHVHVRRFARGRDPRSSRYFRILNEVPTVLMVVIVIMVIVRPF